MNIKPIIKKIEPEFISKVRSGGKVDIITLPKEIQQHFNLEKGKAYKFRILEEIKLQQGAVMWINPFTEVVSLAEIST